MTECPFAQLRSVERALIEADGVPLMGGIPEFPWDVFAEKVRQSFDLSTLQISPSNPHWIEAETLYDSRIEAVSMSSPTLDGSLAWLIEESELGQLVQMLGGGPHAALLADRPMRQGFTRFLAVEIIGILRSLDYPQPLIPKISEPHPLTGPALTTEITVSSGAYKARMSLLMSKDLCHCARHYFSDRAYTRRSQDLAHIATVPVHIQLGEVELDAAEFEQLHVGDFVVLDQSGVDPTTQEGIVALEVAGKRFAQAQVRGNQLELEELGHERR